LSANKAGRPRRREDQSKDLAELRKKIDEVAGSVPGLLRAVEEVAEDNVALVKAVKHAADEQGNLRATLLGEIDQLRSELTGKMISQALRQACREFAPVVHALQRMLDENDFDNAATTREHVGSVLTTLESGLTRMKIERVPITAGQDPFNPHIHECVGVCRASDSPFPDAVTGTIVRVQEHGYRVQGRLALPAKVWVQKLEAAESQSQKEADA
jgi:molecular chaperone GrpE (heat shock protein)